MVATRRNKQRSAKAGINWKGFGLRFLAALVLVAGVYNPTGYSFFHWAIYQGDGQWFSNFGVEKVLVGIIIAIGWVLYVAATLNSLGKIGTFIVSILLAVIVWWLYDIGLLDVKNAQTMTYISILGLSFVMALGMYWSKIWRVMTGQVNIAEDYDDDGE